MKVKLNYEFALKDFEATRLNHLGKIERLKRAIKKLNGESIYGFEMDWGNFQEIVEYHAKMTSFYNYSLLDEKGWVNQLSPKQRLRMVKTFINDQTRQQIVRELENRELPKSWDTAFYLLFYKKINRIMKDLAKNYGF